MPENRYILWMHEPPPDDWLEQHMVVDGQAQGGIIFTEELGHDPGATHGRDYSKWAARGFGVIARLNNGYGAAGTIPLDPGLYPDFAARCARWVRYSQGCNHWVLANEPNSSVEGLIPVDDYAGCFKLCYQAIKEVQPDAVIMPAPVAMWNAEQWDWLTYYSHMLTACAPFDALCWHTYTHGSEPELIRSMQTMEPPYNGRLFQFRAYQDLWDWTPAEFLHLPIHITEADQGDVGGVRNPWLDEPSVTWIQKAVREIDDFNQGHGYPIHCLAMYRWPRYDEWHIEGKPHVHEDFGRAVELGFTWKDEEEPPMVDWTPTYTNHCDDYQEQGSSEVKVLEGWIVDWNRAMPRPEMAFKYEPQPEVYSLDPPRSGVGFHVNTTFDWWMRTEQPLHIAAGVRTKLSVALMVVAHGIEGDLDKLGDCGMIIGFGDPDVTDVNSPDILWSEWHTVRDGPGGDLEEYAWITAETPEVIPSVGLCTLWIRCVANVAADISAGHYDLIQVLQITDGAVEPPIEPPTGTYTMQVLDSAGTVIASCPFDVTSVNAQICGHARAIVELSCEGD